MATDPSATDPGALDPATRSRLAHCLNYYDTGSPLEADVQALWRAYNAQAARLMEVEAERDAWKNAHDGGECKFKWLYNECRQWGLEHKERADAQAAQLAAVSDALMYAIGIICNVEQPTVTPDVPWEPLRRRFLDQALAALGPPAAELAPRTEAPCAPPGEEP